MLQSITQDTKNQIKDSKKANEEIKCDKVMTKDDITPAKKKADCKIQPKVEATQDKSTPVLRSEK